MKNIFVGNLSFGTTEDTLRSMFDSYGAVQRVNIVTDRDTGQARGFAFVEMSVDAEGLPLTRFVNSCGSNAVSFWTHAFANRKKETGSRLPESEIWISSRRRSATGSPLASVAANRNVRMAWPGFGWGF